MSNLGAFPASSQLGGFVESKLGARTGACRPTIHLEFSGFSACSYGCIAASWSSFNSRRYDSISFTFGFDFALVSSAGGICTYRGDVAIVDMLKFTGYSLVGCAGSTASFVITTATVEAQIQADRLIAASAVSSSSFGEGSGTDDIEIFSWAGDEAIGVAVSNQLACGSSGTDLYGSGGVASSTGTMTASYP